MSHAKPFSCLACRQFSLFPQAGTFFIRLRPDRRQPSEIHASRLCRRNALRLPLLDELAFRLRHIAEQLQHDVGDQRADQVLALAGIQQRHVQHHDVCAGVLRDLLPLLQDSTSGGAPFRMERKKRQM